MSKLRVSSGGGYWVKPVEPSPDAVRPSGLPPARPTRRAPAMTEAQFQQSITDLAAHAGWKRYHTLRSKGSDAGWPDLVFCRPPELLIVELKAERGKLSAAQREWLQTLDMCGVEIYVWRPSQWAEIEERLTRPRSGTVHWTGTRLEGDLA